MIRLALCLSLLITSACGSRSDDTSTRPIDSFVSPDRERLSNLETGPSGSGRILFSTPLLSLESSEHYLLEFRLLEEGSEIKVYSHLSSFKDFDGFEISLKREGEEFIIRASSPGRLTSEVARFTSEAPSSVQRLRFEVHNGVAQGVRFLIWKDRITIDGLTWSQLDKVTEANASYDSQDEAAVFLSRGRGIFWGLELTKAQISVARREAPYVR